jgi:hypothetical protein
MGLNPMHGYLNLVDHVCYVVLEDQEKAQGPFHSNRPRRWRLYLNHKGFGQRRAHTGIP